MIYANFLYFILAITVFSMAPQNPSRFFSTPEDLLGLSVAVFIFWIFNRNQFSQLKNRLINQDISISNARKQVQTTISINTLFAIVLFAFEIFVFDLKILIQSIPMVGSSEFFINCTGLGLFMLHLSLIWNGAYQQLGSPLNLGPSAGHYIRGNIRFNLVIVIPWLLLSLILDLIFFVRMPGFNQLLDSAIAQIILFSLFVFLFTVFAPILITYLWECRSIEDKQLIDDINSMCRRQGIGFKRILSWNALNQSLVTAGVIGIFPPFRYLLITPGLMNLLDKDEILAVVGHEIGHVKKRHLLFYIIFFIGFVVISIGSVDRLLKLLLNTPFGFNMVISSSGSINTDIVSFISITITMALFIIYFRYIFGYFMRNFERQADLYYQKMDLDPNLLISSFMKLGALIGDDGRRSNWHHFNISQRIDCLRDSIKNPEIISSHNRKLSRSLILFTIILAVFAAISFNPYTSRLDMGLNLDLMSKVVERRIEENPGSFELRTLLATLFYETEKWQAARGEYEKTLELEYNQPNALNNLAWLLLTCPDTSIHNPKKALRLAEDAIKLSREAHIFDTLAEAYLANLKFKEAYEASRLAWRTARVNQKYFQEQLQKMKRAYELKRKSTKI